MEVLDPNPETRNLIWYFPKIKGTLVGGPDKKDYSILGSRLGFLFFGKLPYFLVYPFITTMSSRKGPMILGRPPTLNPI